MRRAQSALLLLSAFASFFVVARPAEAQEPTENHASPQPHVSVALERVGGFSYTLLAAKDTSDKASLTAFALGNVTVNPYVAPRIGVDAILDPGVTIGAGVSVARFSLSGTTTTTTTVNGTTTTSTSASQDLGSLFLYTLTPRVGYRIVAAPEFDITPRVGMTLAGGSVTSGDGKNSGGVFALAISGEGVAAWRVTRSLNLLGGLGLDLTVAASASSTEQTSNGTRSTTQDIKGSLFAGQLWLGMGGYL
jgi:hypothetical protein